MKIIQKLKEFHDEHNERHRPSGLGLVLADSIHYLNARHWDAIVGGQSFFLSRDYLSVLEAHGPANLEPRYGLVYREAEPVAVLRAQFAKVSADQITGQKSMEMLRARLLIAGDLLTTGFHCAAFAEKEDPETLWPAIAEGLYRLRRAEKLSGEVDLVVLKDFDGAAPRALKRFDYRPFQTQPNMVLDIPPAWKSFEDYLSALTAKYRKGAREVIERVGQAGYVLETLSDCAGVADRLHELYLQVQSEAEVRFFALPPAFLPAMAKSAGSRFLCFVLRKENEIAGFVTLVRDGPTAVGYFIGFDRQANKSVPIYFRLLYAVLESAIAWGCSRLSLGRTALEPKARLGARPVPMTVWMRHRIPAVNLVVRQVLGLIRHEDAPERNPFK